MTVGFEGGGAWVIKDGGQVMDAHELAAVFAHSAHVMSIKIRACFTESAHTVHMLHIDVSRSS